MIHNHLPLFASLFFVSLLTTVILERAFIPYLSRKAKQPIYEGGPAWHMRKTGTPTMGGLAFLIAGTIALLFAMFALYALSETDAAVSLLITTVFCVMNSFVGIIDDLTKLKHSENAGLSPMQKLFLQFVFSTVFLILRHTLLNEDSTISFLYDNNSYSITENY